MGLRFMRVAIWTCLVTATIRDGFCALNHQMAAFLPAIARIVTLFACGAAFKIKFAVGLVRAFVDGSKPATCRFQRSTFTIGTGNSRWSKLATIFFCILRFLCHDYPARLCPITRQATIIPSHYTPLCREFLLLFEIEAVV